MKQKCYDERPKQFVEPNNSEALERTLKGIIPKHTQKSEQWALRVLTLSASEWITERNKCCSKNVLGSISRDRRRRKACKVVILAYSRTAQEK